MVFGLIGLESDIFEELKNSHPKKKKVSGKIEHEFYFTVHQFCNLLLDSIVFS